MSEVRLKSSLKPIFSQYPIVVSYLFGSQATQRATPLSDYDFAVAFSSRVKLAQYPRYKLQLTTKLLRINNAPWVDLVVLNDVKTPLLLKFNIIKEGRVIYEKNKKERQQLECDILLKWYDQEYFECLWHTLFTKNLAQGKI